MRSDLPPAEHAQPLRISGARRETVSAQAVFRPLENVAAATIAVTHLRHTRQDSIIPAGNIKLQWVRYIDIDRNTSGIPPDELVAKAPSSIPDPYWEDATIGVNSNQAQPVWIEVRVPDDATPGDYKGKLTVQAVNKFVELPVVLHVWDFDVPKERHLSTVNWWKFPGFGLEGTVEPFSPDYWDLLRCSCTFLVDHRQTHISGSLDLIVESGNTEKGYSYDTSRLEHFAEVAFETGIRQIQLHRVGYGTAGRSDPASRVKIDESNLRRLAALEKVIVRRRWQNRFTVSIFDEPAVHHERSYSAAVDLVHKTAPSVLCMEAVETEFLGKLDIYVPKLTHLNLWYPQYDRIRREGAELWFYTCCHPMGRYPNRFLDQSLLKVRVLHWLNYLYDLDGYLHWGLNQYDRKEPLYTQQSISFEMGTQVFQGDRAVVYPGREGLLGSLRFSAQRDGLQDFEYLWVLENKLRKLKERIGDDTFWLDPRQRPLELCRRVIWSPYDYTRDEDLLLETRRAIAEEIEAMQKQPLLVVQTSPPDRTTVPARPRHINVRGLVSPGANVTINNKSVKNIEPSGYFFFDHYMADEPTVTVTVEHRGEKRTVRRIFKLAD
jgi:hypothetical protein